jgi:hypothetical protein
MNSGGSLTLNYCTLSGNTAQTSSLGDVAIGSLDGTVSINKHLAFRAILTPAALFLSLVVA